MEIILLLPLISLILLFLLLTFFFWLCISNCHLLCDDGINISDILCLPRSTSNPTNQDTVTAPEEIICNQPNISPVVKDQQKKFKRRQTAPM